MSKRYVLNPKTNRLVAADGFTGLKLINQLLNKNIQVKYQSTKKKQPVVKKPTPTKKPTPEKTTKKKQTPEKTPTKKQTVVKKETPKKKSTFVYQDRQVGIFQKYDKIVEEIKSVYTPLKEKVMKMYDKYNGEDPYDGFPDNYYIKFNKLKTDMPVFVKFSLFSDKRIKQIIKSCYELLLNAYENMRKVNPLDYLDYVLNSILVGEPTTELKPLLVFLGQYDPDMIDQKLDVAKIKPLTESRLLNFNTALKTTERDHYWDDNKQYFKL